MAKMPLAIVSSPRVGPTFSSWSGVGFEARRQAAGPEHLDQVLDFLGLEALRAPFDDPRVADLRVDRRGRHDQVVEQDRELILERVPFLGEVLAGRACRTARAPAVELEADGRLEPLVLSRAVDLAQVLAGDLLAWPVEVAEDRASRSGPGATFSSRMIGSLGRGLFGSPPRMLARVVLDPVRRDRLQRRAACRGSACWPCSGAISHDVGRLVARGVLAGQVDVGPGVEVLLPRSAAGR